MDSVISSGCVKARKAYHTDGDCYFDFALNHKKKEYDLQEFKSIEMTDEEIQTVLLAKSRGWMIEKGEVYYQQIGKYEGELYQYRAIKAIHDICVKYDLYDE